IDRQVVRRDPTEIVDDLTVPKRHVAEGKAWIDGVEEAVTLIEVLPESCTEGTNRRYHDLRCKGDRCDSSRGCDRAVVHDLRCRSAARHVREEAAFLVVEELNGVRRAVARGQAPYLAVIAPPTHWILPGVLALRIRGSAA